MELGQAKWFPRGVRKIARQTDFYSVHTRQSHYAFLNGALKLKSYETGDVEWGRNVVLKEQRENEKRGGEKQIEEGKNVRKGERKRRQRKESVF